MMRAVIIDDEVIGISALKVLIEKHTKGIVVVDSATDPMQGIQLIEEIKPDVVFLDVSMPKMNGFDLLNRLQYKAFKLVFTTAHQEFVIKAIKNRAHDYLLKPIDIIELKNCVNKLTSEVVEPVLAMGNKQSNLVEIAVKDGIIFIRPEEIIRLQADGSYTTFFLENGSKHIASKNLKECESLLDPSVFYRCHQSHVINLNKVVKMVSANGFFAQMTDGSMPEIGKKNKEFFLEKLKNI